MGGEGTANLVSWVGECWMCTDPTAQQDMAEQLLELFLANFLVLSPANLN